ncbi:hypothetical protein MTO96_030053, partial [Rhipicephalus appendiculatus]
MDPTIASAIESSMVKSDVSTMSEAQAENSSRWMFAASITIFCLIASFCFAIFIFTTAISDQKETTLVDEDLDLGGGNEDKQTTKTTQKPIIIDMKT